VKTAAVARDAVTLAPSFELLPDDARVQQPPRARVVARTLADYLALTKPRLNGLVVASSAAGYYLGAQAPLDICAMAQAVGGTALVAAGAAALNQCAERDTDAMMRRTRTRPLPAGRISPPAAWIFGVLLSTAGIAILWLSATTLAAALAFATLALYLGVYTPMKRRTPLAVLVGAVPGALPPLIGWSAAQGSIGVGGAVLFAIVFFWQMPHFMAIAWLYRYDYLRAGLLMRSDGRRTGLTAAVFATTLLPVSLLPPVIGMTGLSYAAVAGALGLVLLWLAARFAKEQSNIAARALFLGSIVYLPVLWVVMIVDRW
jgi:heme o synthase